MNSSEILVKRPVSEDLLEIRSVFLNHLLAGQVVPQRAWDNHAGHSEVTIWEELLCVAFYPDLNRLMAVVDIPRPDGYSGMLRRHGSVEYVRFFIDWGRGEGYEPVSLTHFKVSDAPVDGDRRREPLRKTLSAIFDADRYWGCILDGIQPKVRAVLSWNQVPELDPEFTPLFGNVVDSVIWVKSDEEMKMLMQPPSYNEAIKLDHEGELIYRPSPSSPSAPGSAL
jgi:hypothetical protein